MKKLGILSLTLLLGLALGAFLMHFLQRGEETTRESASVLLEQIEEVSKFITVEGHFSEIYRYDKFWLYDISPLKKKALVRVNATVQVGYDLEGASMEVDEGEREIRVQLPENAEILSIEKSLDYFDLKEGTFNQFNAEDFSRIDKNVVGFIRGLVVDSDLEEIAEQRLEESIETMRFIASQAGYQLRVSGIAVEGEEMPGVVD